MHLVPCLTTARSLRVPEFHGIPSLARATEKMLFGSALSITKPDDAFYRCFDTQPLCELSTDHVRYAAADALLTGMLGAWCEADAIARATAGDAGTEGGEGAVVPPSCAASSTVAPAAQVAPKPCGGVG